MNIKFQRKNYRHEVVVGKKIIIIAVIRALIMYILFLINGVM